MATSFLCLKDKKQEVQIKSKYNERNDSLLLCYYLSNVAPIGWLWRWVFLCVYIMILPIGQGALGMKVVVGLRLPRGIFYSCPLSC